ncbi:hypothetical protein [Aeoliella mucimassa]|uniref:Transmembrane protein n=1 Tax=Aeoliella mucimassa TaxID=2527972 RepID=A0A518AL49_9BACT|nr:hypothetical protein [Aeoliella mucimassa]QDU55404.1 hypothetical protein Pan181_15930 [Aeoliella mucimassa]
MGPLVGLWRDTWWVWLILAVLVIVLGVLVTWFYFVMLPALPGMFVYFAFNRYDENGNEKPDVDR